jgi:hypothetical protein
MLAMPVGTSAAQSCRASVFADEYDAGSIDGKLLREIIRMRRAKGIENIVCETSSVIHRRRRCRRCQFRAGPGLALVMLRLARPYVES